MAGDSQLGVFGELLNAIHLGITERLTSPLLGTYVLSFIFFNFRIVLIIFGDASLDHKMALFDERLSLNHWPYVFGAPIAFTLFYVYLYPRIATPVYAMRLRFLSGLSALRQQEEGSRLLDVETSRRLLVEMHDQQVKFDDEQRRSQELITALRQQLTTAARGLDKPISTPQALSNDITKQQLASYDDDIALALLAATYGSTYGAIQNSLSYLRQRIPHLSGTVSAQAVLNGLQKRGLVIIAGNNQEFIKLTDLGVEYVAKHGLDQKDKLEQLIKAATDSAKAAAN